MENIEVLTGLREHGFTSKVGFDPSIFKTERIEAIRTIIREHLIPIKRISAYEAGRSYVLKHKFEDYAFRTGDPVLGNYVTNGECIYAMYLEGYMVKREPDGQNAFFNVSKKSFEEFRELVNSLKK